MKSGCLFIKALFLRFMLRNGELGETRPGQNQISVFHHACSRKYPNVVDRRRSVFFCWLPLSITHLSVIYRSKNLKAGAMQVYLRIYRGSVASASD